VKPKRVGRFASPGARLRAEHRRPTKEDFKIASEILAALKGLWDRLDSEVEIVDPERPNTVSYRCKLNPDNLIVLPYRLYREWENGELPVVADKSREELVRKIMSISLYQTHGSYCGFELQDNLHYLVRLMMGKRLRPPLVQVVKGRKRYPLDLTADEAKSLGLERARSFRFADEHPACIRQPGLIDMMSRLEALFTGPETPEKDIQRLGVYQKTLLERDDTGMTLIERIARQEPVWNPKTRTEDPISVRIIVQRMKAINNNLNKHVED
jgi:hypothetical protein